jgi:hypothetical protein
MKKVYLATIINQSINIVYTAIFFSPVILLWKDYYTTVFFKIALGITLSSFFLPNRFYTFFQISDSKRFYKKMGIPIFQQFTQQGKLAKRITTYFGGKVLLLPKEKRLKQLKGQIRSFETFHWACFIFFNLTAVHAFQNGKAILFIVILTSNVMYNVIPILIQQYNRIRLKNMSI